jgi:hypothetical protein
MDGVIEENGPETHCSTQSADARHVKIHTSVQEPWQHINIMEALGKGFVAASTS